MLSLLVLDIIQGLGVMLDVRWIHDGITRPGSYCTAQGIIQQIGETGVAMTTSAISIHTFLVVWFRMDMRARPASWIAPIVIGLIWVFVLAYSLGGALHAKLYEAPDPYWCWIAGSGRHYLPDKLVGEYLWIWLTLFLLMTLHIPLWLLVRGYITLRDESPWKPRVHLRRNGGMKDVHLGILAYPVTYSIVTLPLSVVRWITFRTGIESSALTFAIDPIFCLGGFANVLLLLLFRSDLLLFRAVKERRIFEPGYMRRLASNGVVGGEDWSEAEGKRHQMRNSSTGGAPSIASSDGENVCVVDGGSA
ncbi:hypothetical protein PUNSTDRAFT_124875 [Punctularia strigosozonata HHB-11173 SS5]|uniref:uncharacterized protein n=1 Tax=Punctularia strigosozonata (strain HHB-11173) TaxID=741275 RepID=UPI0004416388|nr:uncharacterized protein PUNSTDRAFT_124875 [Punctularia strigosozonata HHB-11173 SS5]EIN11597.1 hypothetical protein PUNSTDRAFT_124875 [Punctularia strigosozonata HHB-11173 SS5]